MCRQDSRVRLSAEEEMEAEESLSIYCKPVELYNILQRRAIRNVNASQILSLSFLFSLQFSNSKHFFFFLFLFSLRFCRDVCVTKYRRNTKGGKSFFQLSKIFISSLNLVLLTYLLGFFFFFFLGVG